MRRTYVLRDGRMVDKATGEPMNSGPWVPVTPMTFGDLPGYRSPIDGAWIDGRRARRYDLEKHDCVPAEPSAKREPGKFRNERFARKWGLPHE